MTDPATLTVVNFEVSWSSFISMSLRTRTLIQQGENGDEVRTAINARPTLALTYEFSEMESVEDSRALAKFLSLNINKRLAVPIWSQAILLTGAAVGINIPVEDTTDTFFTTDRGALLWKSRTEFEVVDVATVGVNLITASVGITGTFGDGDMLLPLMVSDELLGGNRILSSSASLNQAVATFTESVKESLTIPATETLPAYRSLSIVPLFFNWLSLPNYSDTQDRGALTTESGVQSVVGLQANARLTINAQISLWSKEDMMLFLTLFINSRGRAKAFWLPSNKQDFTLSEDTDGTANIKVIDQNYTEDEFSKAHRQVIILISDTNWYARKVTASVDLGGDVEQLTLESTVPVLTALNTEIHYLYLMRFDLDEIELQYNSTTLANSPVTFHELVDEVAALLTGTDPSTGTVNGSTWNLEA